jgi:hypothetical protein
VIEANLRYLLPTVLAHGYSRAEIMRLMADVLNEVCLSDASCVLADFSSPTRLRHTISGCTPFTREKLDVSQPLTCVFLPCAVRLDGYSPTESAVQSGQDVVPPIASD